MIRVSFGVASFSLIAFGSLLVSVGLLLRGAAALPERVSSRPR